ncbi:MAG: PepSY-associated TM helix domain-containing protein [Gordonia sp. (in: high G+C Gram-positive bacteria)]
MVTTGPLGTAGAAPPSARPRSAAADRWRPLLLRWHFYAGLLVGPFLLVAAITGLLYTLTPQIDRAVYRHELTVDHVGAHRLPLSAQVRAARAAHPEGTICSITPAPTADGTTRVGIATDDVPAEAIRTVFVDPYTGDVRGALTTYGEWLPVRAWFDDLHRTLHLGEIGRNYSEIAASWLWVVALGGLVLWIGHRRRTRTLARLARPDRTGPGATGDSTAARRRRTLSWHAAVGVWILVGLIGLSATGLTWSRFAGEHIGEVRSALSWVTPSVSTATPGVTPVDDAALVAQATGVARAARAAGLRDPMVLTPPAGPGAAWQVTENQRTVPTRADAVAINPAGDTVVDRVAFADWPVMAKMTRWTIDAHMGLLFGLLNQIVLALLALGLISVIVRGYLLWWRRRPSGRALPGAPPRGTLAALRPGEAVGLIAVIVGVGWFVPWFGLTLGLFTVIDAARGIVADRRVEAGR